MFPVVNKPELYEPDFCLVANKSTANYSFVLLMLLLVQPEKVSYFELAN